MTEAEWLSSADTDDMLAHLETRPDWTPRLQRLFGCARWRRMWHALGSDPCRRGLEVTESHADGLVSDEDLAAAAAASNAAWNADCLPAFETAWVATRVEYPDILRSMIPYTVPTFSPRWRTSDVVALAHAAYEERPSENGSLCPERLAILADALEEAGAPETVTAHLRSGLHVRGCWVADMATGRR